jgi:hypothetical protein
MEYRTHAGQRDADSASGALADLGPGSAQQRLDITPAQIGGRRFYEDAPKGSTMTAVHTA